MFLAAFTAAPCAWLLYTAPDIERVQKGWVVWYRKVSGWQEVVGLVGRRRSGTISENLKQVVVEPSLPRKSGFTVSKGVAPFFGWKKNEGEKCGGGKIEIHAK